MVYIYIYTGIFPWKWNAYTSLVLGDTNGSFNPSPKTKPSFNQPLEKYLSSSRLGSSCKPQSENKRKRKTCHKTKKKLWNMKVTVIPIVVRDLGTVLKNLKRRQGELEIRRIAAMQITARILRRVLEIWGNLIFTSVKINRSELV